MKVAKQTSVNRPTKTKIPSGPAKTKPASPSPSPEPSPIRVLKIAECPSISLQSTLTYHVGRDHGGQILLRVYGNTGGGQFNPDWVPLTALRDSLAEYPKDRPMSAAALRPLFKHRSVNTPAFLFAVLIAEDLVSRVPGNAYSLGDAGPFLQSIQALADSKVDLSAEVDTPQSATG
jgi:hypothetical protein